MSILCMSDSKKISTPMEVMQVLNLKGSPKFYYVSQDNYYFCNRDKDVTLYCDSATSCIVIIVTGKDKTGKELVGISHLSRPGRFKRFFEEVKIRFSGEICVYASGANPPEPCLKSDGTYDSTALRNAKQVADWISNGNTNVKQVTMNFGQNNPAIYTNNLDCYSISLSDLRVSNDRLYLTDIDRDPTSGVQTLFCVYGDPNTIRDQSLAFTTEEIDTLVRAARNNDFGKAAYMTDEQILKTYSSTPDFEVPWFCSTIRAAGKFTNDYVI